MINLFICNDPEAWKSNTYFFERDRCLTEYIAPEQKAKYSNLNSESIEKIITYPCIFTYERIHRKDAYIGRIKNILVRQSNIRFDYELSGDIIQFDDFIKLKSLLDMGDWEQNRTHWTIKNVLLEELRPYFLESATSKPTVFISYSWSPPDNQRRVFDLVNRLTTDGIRVIYDKKDLQPGQNKDHFIEHALTSKEIDNVLVVCNRDYAEKADGRLGGVGQEMSIITPQLLSNPLQERIVPVVIEKDETGNAYIPISLTSLLYIDLTKENGYNDLFNTIHKSNNAR